MWVMRMDWGKASANRRRRDRHVQRRASSSEAEDLVEHQSDSGLARRSRYHLRNGEARQTKRIRDVPPRSKR